ncbi:MAG: hypothetical protein R3C45_18305 [Phycisphaerales bacterium]
MIRQNNRSTLVAAKRALLGANRRNVESPAQPLVDGAARLIRDHPAACLAGAAAVGAVVATQPWARRLLVGTARKAAGFVVMKALARDRHR